MFSQTSRWSIFTWNDWFYWLLGIINNLSIFQNFIKTAIYWWIWFYFDWDIDSLGSGAGPGSKLKFTNQTNISLSISS